MLVKRIVVFGGGEGVSALSRELKKTPAHIDYIVPISDNGGSSAEIMKWFGGPSIGDLRKRLTDISGDDSAEGLSINRVLRHRISDEQEWHEMVLGRHVLWNGISPRYRDVIRADLVYFDMLVKQQAPRFDFRNASIGNCFFSGARMRMHSLSAAIFMFSRVAMIQRANVIPVIDSDRHITIGCELEEGTVVRGQNEISHPGELVDKECAVPLSSRISRLFYINEDGHEFFPLVNPDVLEAIDRADMIIYGMGSFWTSLMPDLILPGIGERIFRRKVPKVFILNGYQDRETFGMDAEEYLQGIMRNMPYAQISAADLFTDLIWLEGTDIPVPEQLLARQYRVNLWKLHPDRSTGRVRYDSTAVGQVLQELLERNASEG